MTFFLFFCLFPFFESYIFPRASQNIESALTPSPISEKFNGHCPPVYSYYTTSEVLSAPTTFFRFLDRYFKYFNVTTLGSIKYIPTYNNIYM